MANVKRTFTLPDELSQALDANIPYKERSGFIAQTLFSALKERKRQAALDALNSIQPHQIPVGKKGIVEALREVRHSTISDLENS